MNLITGTVFMVIGLLTFIIGMAALIKSKQEKPKVNILKKVIEMAIADGVLTENEKKIIAQIAIENKLDYNKIIIDVENKMLDSANDAETEIINYNKKNGDDFEKYVIQKFDDKYFKIKEWAGDKYVNGKYAKTTPQPDILLEFNLNENKFEFSVECKWRKRLYKNGVEFATKEQFKRYNNFQNEMNIPVFITIGTKGKGNKPEELFVVPLSEIKSNFIHISVLRNYKKEINSKFFFDYAAKSLR